MPLEHPFLPNNEQAFKIETGSGRLKLQVLILKQLMQTIGLKETDRQTMSKVIVAYRTLIHEDIKEHGEDTCYLRRFEAVLETKDEAMQQAIVDEILPYILEKIGGDN